MKSQFQSQSQHLDENKKKYGSKRLRLRVTSDEDFHFIVKTHIKMLENLHYKYSHSSLTINSNLLHFIISPTVRLRSKTISKINHNYLNFQFEFSIQ